LRQTKFVPKVHQLTSKADKRVGNALRQTKFVPKVHQLTSKADKGGSCVEVNKVCAEGAPID